jgi:hypothetical protein
MTDDIEKLKTLLGPPFFDDVGELVEVVFTLYTASLCSENMIIAIKSACEITCSDGRPWVWRPEERGRDERVGEPLISDMKGFARLLGAKIRSHEVLPGVKLRLTFSNGCQLLLCEDDSGYESFIIDKKEGPGAAYIVV